MIHYAFMLRRSFYRFVSACVFLRSTTAQVSTDSEAMPSREEIAELLAKAEEKVTAFEQAVNPVRSDLEKQQPDILKRARNAATAAHTLIRGVRSNGPSAYGLVALITALDDVTLNAAKTATAILIMNRCGMDNAATRAKLVLLWESQNSLCDISELITHATLRLIQVEESIIHQPSGPRK